MSLQAPGQGQVGDITPSSLHAGADTETLHRTCPISHGAAISTVLDDDNATYDALRELWRDRVDDPDAEVQIAEADISFNGSGEFVWVFSSSGYKAGSENQYGNWKQWYKYHIKLRRVNRNAETGEIESLSKPPVSVHVIVEPQKEGMTYDPDDNGGDLVEVELPYGEGTRVQTQTTYVERPSQPVRRGIDAVRDVLAVRDDQDLADAGAIKRDSCRIWKLEAYYRFDIEQKHALVRTIDKSESLIDVGGGADVETWRDRQEEGWLESRLTSDRWDHLGFESATTRAVEDGEETDVEYERELKVYQASDWHEKPPSDYAHHPKVEASLAGGRNPHIDEWHSVLERLRELVISHCEWAGIDDGDLISDDYFRPASQPTIEIEHPDGRREDLRRYYNRFEAVVYSECLKWDQNRACYDILSTLVERRGCGYETLAAETGYSRSNLQYHIGRLVDVGLLETVGNPATICFKSEALLEIVEDSMEDVASALGEETLAKRRLEREDRADDREQAREDGEANGTHDREPDADDLGPDARGGDEEDDPLPFAYLDEWSGTLAMVQEQLVDDDHPRGDRDVRLRVFPGHDPGGGWK